MKLKSLVGCGDKIGLLTLPVLAIGGTLNIARPSWFAVGGPPPFLRALAIIILIPGLAVWVWSVALILIKVPRNELITGGPFALVKHPLYTGVAFLVLPWIGFLADTWLGVAVGLVLYLGSRLFSPREEEALAATFGAAWEEYRSRVRFPRL